MSSPILRTTIVTACLALSASPLVAQTPERFTVTGDRIAIYDLAGQITVAPGSGADVVVEVTRGGADAGQLKVEMGPIGSQQTLRVIFPDDDIVYRQDHDNGRSQFWVRDDGTFGGSDRDRDRGHQVEVRSSGRGLEAHADLRILVPAGKRVSVNVGVGRLGASDVNANLSLDAASANITAERVRGALNIDTGSGDVKVTTVEGDLNIDTGSGNVELAGATGDVDVDTGSGDVTGSGVKASNLKLDTGSGNITMSQIQSPAISLETGSGDIELGLLSDTDDLSVDTGSGNVTIRLPADFGSAIDVETSSGEVDTDVAITVTRRSESRLVGRIGDGQGRMTIETGSGNVTLHGAH
jgi:lia operon protein LiaG